VSESLVGLGPRSGSMSLLLGRNVQLRQGSAFQMHVTKGSNNENVTYIHKMEERWKSAPRAHARDVAFRFHTHVN
jgi:hypothetical protein